MDFSSPWLMLGLIIFIIIPFAVLFWIMIMLFRGHHPAFGILMLIGLLISSVAIGFDLNTNISFAQQQAAVQYQLNHADQKTKLSWLNGDSQSDKRYTKHYLMTHHHMHAKLAGYEVSDDGNDTNYPLTIDHKHWSSVDVLYQHGKNYIKSISIGKYDH